MLNLEKQVEKANKKAKEAEEAFAAATQGLAKMRLKSAKSGKTPIKKLKSAPKSKNASKSKEKVVE